MLKVENLVKSFGEKIAVDRLNIEMNAPGVFGLIGTNGAGKTTAIRSILGIMTPDSGHATWNGKKISRETLEFGYMPEERGIYMKTKVMEHLIYFGMLRGMTKASAKNAALNYMEALHVTEYKDMPAEKLSKGNQQKIQLIATLIHDPKLVFLDEPFSGLDPVNAEVLSQLIESLVKEGKYIIMSSHQMEVVEDYCNDILLLHKGKSILNGNLKIIKGGYGHRNLIINTDGQIEGIAEKAGMQLLEKSTSVLEYKITGKKMAEDFLKQLIAQDVCPVHFEIKEPSLHEIFIEKVGEQQ